MKSNIIDKRIEIGRFSNFQFPNENRPNNSLCRVGNEDGTVEKIALLSKKVLFTSVKNI